MNAIWRNCICRLRPGKGPHRFQSGAPPVAPLGSRILTDPAKVFEHNMWDHVQWSKEEEDAARKKVEENSATRVAPEEQVKFESDASKYWDTFYQTHKNKFFKNRNWLLREFPEILPDDQTTKEKEREPSWDQVRNNLSRIPGMESHCGEHSISSEPWSKARSDSANPDLEEHSKRSGKAEQFPGSNATFRVLEVGCGAGNSVFPILNTLHLNTVDSGFECLFHLHRNIPGSFLYCCDFAPEAVELVKHRVHPWPFVAELLQFLEVISTDAKVRRGCLDAKSHESYSEAHCSAFIHDVCDGGLAYPFPDGSLDVVLLIFVLSSIHPDRMQAVVHRLSRLLKPGGMILFRDHGRYDNVQLRLKRTLSI